MKTLWYCSLLAVLVGCQSVGPDSDVPNSMLAYVPESGQQDIERARRQRSEANEALAIALRDANEVASLVELSENDLDVALARHDEAVDQTDHAERYGTQQELDTARERREQAQDAVRLARAKARYYEDLEHLASERVAWMEKRVELADARYELQKAEAVSELDRPAAKGVDVSAYREAVARLEDEVAREAMEVEVAHTQAGLQADFVAAKRDRVPDNFRLNEITPIDKVFFSKLAADEPDPLIREASFRGGLDTSGPKEDSTAEPTSDEPAKPDGGR